MTFSIVLKKFFAKIVFAGLPIVNLYHQVTHNTFFNAEISNSHGIEYIANQCLNPVYYLFGGYTLTVVEKQQNAVLELKQKYDYSDGFFMKAAASVVSLPVSLPLGYFLKTIAFLDPNVRSRYSQVQSLIRLHKVENFQKFYQSIGIDTRSYLEGEEGECLNYERREEDKLNMKEEQHALKEICKVLTDHNILFWIDCGTCLGAYRYGGVIPWDFDIDLAILQKDFDNVWNALSSLDPSEYAIQDWSGRDRPKTYIKVYVKSSHSLIDIYHFEIDENKKVIRSILSNEGSIFLPEFWKIRERRYTLDTPFAQVFPLKKAFFDGIVVPVPNQTKEYLQGRYGENLGPNRIYNALTQKYEKDATHPYWQLEYAH